MVVGVPHGPSAGVALGLLAVGGEHKPAVAVRPLRPRRQPARNLERQILLSVIFIFYSAVYFLSSSSKYFPCSRCQRVTEPE